MIAACHSQVSKHCFTRQSAPERCPKKFETLLTSRKKRVGEPSRGEGGLGGGGRLRLSSKERFDSFEWGVREGILVLKVCARLTDQARSRGYIISMALHFFANHKRFLLTESFQTFHIRALQLKVLPVGVTTTASSAMTPTTVSQPIPTPRRSLTHQLLARS